MKFKSLLLLSIGLAMVLSVTEPCLSQTEEAPVGPVATVNGVQINTADVDLEIKRILFQAKTAKQPIDEAMVEAMRGKVIESLINRELLLQQSKAKGITVDESEIDSSVEQVKQRLQDDQTIESMLTELGISMPVFRDQVKNAATIQKLLEMDVYAKTLVTEKESRIFFENNPQFFKKPEEVKASHILIKVDPQAGDEEKQAARQKILSVREKITAGGDFAELARQYSEGPSGVNGGDLGYFDRQRMVKPFSDAAFAMETGQVSDIVETRFGYHIIKVFDKTPKSAYAYPDVKDRLIELLQRQKIQEETQRYLQELRKEADVQHATL